MNVLPYITSGNDETQILRLCIQQQRDETKLFQFLNGSNELYNTHRSHLLMQNPFPFVESDSALQQEKTQRELFISPQI